MSAAGLRQAQQKMAAASVAPTAIAAFTRLYQILEGGESSFIREQDVEPLPDLPEIDLDSPATLADIDALAHTAIIKLNGGLGTSMGMAAAKSLLPVRQGPVPGGSAQVEMLSFLDVIAGQVLAARQQTGTTLPVIFMNSFRTQADTLGALARYPELISEGLPIDFMQNREPKLQASDLTPVDWQPNPDLEWCPPGHGDLYPALADARFVDRLLAHGFRYLFVSNADNLGAAPDAKVAGWFAASGAPYAAEMCLKSPADVKGGQLVNRKADGQLIQRETAQTHPEDVTAALDPERHRYFHTNNLWFDLHALADELERTGGVLDLPLIRNVKTVDPADPASPAVIQLESAMGAAVRVFPRATAVEVDRRRFLPVKTTDDLLLLRSDVYELTPDYRLTQVAHPPVVQLGPAYQQIAEFDARFPLGPPSLRGAASLKVDGDFTFGQNTRAVGAARLSGAGQVPDGAEIGPAGLG